MEKKDEEKIGLTKFLLGSMNKNSIEVEFKYRVKDEKGLRRWLDKHAKKLYEKRQIDEYFTPAHRNFFGKELPNEYFRIRKTGEKYSTAYKYWYRQKNSREHSHCDEFETDVKDGKQLRKIIKALDFKTLVIVDKHRAAYKYKDFEITIDKVKKVGMVCEIELQSGYSSIREAHILIRKLASEIGFKESDREEDLKQGYAYLIARKSGVIK